MEVLPSLSSFTTSLLSFCASRIPPSLVATMPSALLPSTSQMSFHCCPAATTPGISVTVLGPGASAAALGGRRGNPPPAGGTLQVLSTSGSLLSRAACTPCPVVSPGGFGIWPKATMAPSPPNRTTSSVFDFIQPPISAFQNTNFRERGMIRCLPVTMQRTLHGLTCFALLACSAVPGQTAETENDGVDVVRVRPNFYMIAGAGGNIGVQIGSDGVVLVNAGTAAASGRVLAAIRKLTDLPIRYVIDTNAEADFVGGNGQLAKAGKTIFTNVLGNPALAEAMTNGGAAAILAHDSIMQRMSAPTGKTAAFPDDALPTEAFYAKRYTLRMNDEGIEVLYQPAAHSDADSVVFFRSSDVVVAGDVLDKTRFPVIDIAHGGSIQGEIDALNKLIELAIPPTPFIYKGVGTYVIPGHGRLCEQMEVVDYRDMVVVVRDVIADMIKQGKTLDQIKAASPAKPYETQYGRQEGSTSAFVEAIYKSLTVKK